jgi:hypothetical protein
MSTTETPTPHPQAAAGLVNQLRALMQSIGGFGFVTRAQRRRINASASVSDAFLLQVAQALDASEDFTAAARVTGADLRDAVTFSTAFTPVATELQLFARGLLETIAVRRADAGEQALRAYSVGKSFDRPSQRELLIPHLRDIKSALKRGRRKAPVLPPMPPEPPPAAPAT